MKTLTTGFDAGDRLLNALVAYGRELPSALCKDWHAGDIEIDFNYRFLGTRSNMPPHDAQTTLAFLTAGGFVISIDHDNNHARIGLRLSPGCVL